MMRTDVEMLRHGTDQPTAVVHLSSIGVFDEKRNPAYAKALMEFIVSELEIPDQRFVGCMVTNNNNNNNRRNGSCLTWLATSLEEKRRWLVINASPRGQCSK